MGQGYTNSIRIDVKPAFLYQRHLNAMLYAPNYFANVNHIVLGKLEA